jgi:1,4-dihydroxy-2-naphthoyl-CoA synthase
VTTPSSTSRTTQEKKVVDVAIENGHALVTIDNPPVNPLSVSVRKGLMEAVRQVNEAKCETAAIVCAGRTFVAGGDISEFAGPPPLPHLPDVLDAIEASRTPFIAVMHGTVLGGGLELALACAWRIADEKDQVRPSRGQSRPDPRRRRHPAPAPRDWARARRPHGRERQAGQRHDLRGVRRPRSRLHRRPD